MIAVESRVTPASITSCPSAPSAGTIPSLVATGASAMTAMLRAASGKVKVAANRRLIISQPKKARTATSISATLLL
jgi:hypothetical protein